MKASTTKASHRKIAGTNRGDHQAGITHSNPISSATKNRGPNPNGNLPSADS